MYKVKILLLATMLFLTACGGGESSSSRNTPSKDTQTSQDSPEAQTSQNTSNVDGTSIATTDTQTNQGFAYETQRSVDLNISFTLENRSLQKQILFYETQKIENTPVGEQTVYENLLMEGVSNTDGEYSTQVTLGNHIENIWIIIPALSYEKKVAIDNNTIIINMTEGF